MFLGIGIRTNNLAIRFLTKKLKGDFEVIPIFLNDKEEIIHLDAVFNIISKSIAIIYPEGFKNIPKEITLNYKLINISKNEKDLGACNLLTINQNKLIIRNKLDRIKNILENFGFNCYVANWEETKKTGTVGPRCATLPLRRN